jgi:predicted  nucleic acid-binding Zn-ribbon protein
LAFRVADLSAELARANNDTVNAMKEVVAAKEEVIKAKEEIVVAKEEIVVAKEEVTTAEQHKSALKLKLADLGYELQASRIEVLSLRGTLHMRGMCGERSPQS